MILFYLLCVVSGLIIAGYFYALGRKAGMTKARFMMWAQMYCREKWRTTYDVTKSFNEVLASAPKGGMYPQQKVSFAAGVIWLRQMGEAKMLREVYYEGRRIYLTEMPQKEQT